MLPNRLATLLGIDVPIIQAGMSRFTSAELAAAVSNAGALGSVGCDLRPVDDLIQQLARIAGLTKHPYAINHLLPRLDPQAWSLTLEAKPAVISFAGGDPGEKVSQAHAVGARVMVQVQTVTQACRAAERGADVIVAQGGEAGGHSGTVAALALVPQVVENVAPIPVVAAGGIAEGRGFAAALALGAQGINIGTRFLACAEAPVANEWKQMIVAAQSEDAVKFDAWNEISPLTGHDTAEAAVRTLRTPFVDEWRGRREEARRATAELRRLVKEFTVQGRLHELLPIAGQSAGLVHEILPAKEIVRRLVTEAESALQEAQVMVCGR